MKVYRLCKSKYDRDLSGSGAAIAGGRWNSKGTALLYTSDSRSLCTAEVAVHTPLGILPQDFVLLEIFIPDSSILELDNKSLTNDWKVFPLGINTQKLGDDFVKSNKFLALKVPSAAVQGDFNYLVNPNHEDFFKVKILSSVPYSFDDRLFVNR
jgi:RES domain-containing protein